MAKRKTAKRKAGIGLLPKLLLGVLIPVLLAFLVIWALIFFSVDFKGSSGKKPLMWPPKLKFLLKPVLK
jgi:hypothetical protein